MIYVMDMEFDDDKVLDFGSIKMISVGREMKSNQRIREYILKSTDVEKLKLITNAYDGSSAYCTDTGDLYILHMGDWVKQ